MNLYCNQTVVSNIAIPELPKSDQIKAKFLFHLETCRKARAYRHWSPLLSSIDGDAFLSYSNDITGIWLRFEEIADFCISKSGKKIYCHPMPDIPEETIRHLLIDQVLPRCLAYQGKIILHASAALHDKGLLVFLGDSGVGKSTLAGDFHLAGMPAVSDDCLWIKESRRRIVGVPSYANLRLWEDSAEVLFASKEFRSIAHYSAKKRLLFDEQGFPDQTKGYPVLAVIALSLPGSPSEQEIALSPLSPQEAYIEFIKHTFQLFMNDPEKISRHMETLGQLVPRLPVFRLSIPHDYDLLPAVRRAILEQVARL